MTVYLLVFVHDMLFIFWDIYIQYLQKIYLQKIYHILIIILMTLAAYQCFTVEKTQDRGVQSRTGGALLKFAPRTGTFESVCVCV